MNNTGSVDWHTDLNDSDDSVQIIENASVKKADKTVKRTRASKVTPKRAKKDVSEESKTPTLDNCDADQRTQEDIRAEEEARKKRVAEKQALLNSIFGSYEVMKKLVLDYDAESNKELVTVHPQLFEKLKPHQVAGVTFMWNACFESLKQIETGRGGGCILAHCMGLGKTFQVVTLVHTLLSHPATKVKNVLILCPVNVLLNWRAEFKKWLTNLDGCRINVYDVTRFPDNISRAKQLEEWTISGGVMIFGYEMFRTLISNGNLAENVRQQITNALLNPGPDLVVCDEGHVLKNEKSAISKTIMQMKSLRRIVLTGTPLQNNLLEYFCMVEFVKPKLLGTKKDFQNRFAHPISKGQFQNSEVGDVNVMKERSFVLHRLLDGIVQRFDSNELKPYLPPKHEFVILVAMSSLQTKLYEHYVRNRSQIAQKSVKERGTRLLQDYQNMKLIWTHPMAMKLSLINKRQTSKHDESEDEFSDRSEPEQHYGSGKLSKNSRKSIVKRRRTAEKKPFRRIENVIDVDSDSDSVICLDETDQKPSIKKNNLNSQANESEPWWKNFISSGDFENYNNGPKLTLLFAILKECQQTGEKVLIFSQSLPSLDMIEYFLKKKRDKPQDVDFMGTWERNEDYFRLDGATTKEKRADDCTIFNDPQNKRARLFLISTKAGGLGINLTAANRVIIFDVSWNPSNDIQSIFRVYRFGQNKPSYIYRFVSQGTMEEKMYDRQVTKLSVARRVIDEEQIDRHFTMEQVSDLYAFDRSTGSPKDLPEFPNDHLMAGLLKKYPGLIVNYHKHDSLLENIEEEELTEAERLEAWRGYEIEVANSGEDVITTEELIRSSLKELNPKLSKPKLEKEMNMVRDRLQKFISIEQQKALNQSSSNTSLNFRQSFGQGFGGSHFFGYAPPSRMQDRPLFSMTISKASESETLEKGVGAIPISEDPELAIKQLTLLHYLQHKIPVNDTIWRPLETPCTYKLLWNSPEKTPQSLIALFQKEFSHWKKKPKFTVVERCVLLHLKFCPRKITLEERLLRYGVQVEWVANDLEVAEWLLRSRFTNLRVNIPQPKPNIDGPSDKLQTKEIVCKVLDRENATSNLTATEMETQDYSDDTHFDPYEEEEFEFYGDEFNEQYDEEEPDEDAELESHEETVDSNEEGSEVSECTDATVPEEVVIDSTYEDMYGDLIEEIEEEIYEDDTVVT